MYVYSLIWPRIYNPLALFSQVLELKVCPTVHTSNVIFFKESFSSILGWPWTCYILNDETEVVFKLPAVCRDYRHKASHQALCSAGDRTRTFEYVSQVLCRLSYLLFQHPHPASSCLFLVCSVVYSVSQYIAQLKLPALLPSPPGGWGNRCLPPCLAAVCVYFLLVADLKLMRGFLSVLCSSSQDRTFLRMELWWAFYILF